LTKGALHKNSKMKTHIER